MAIGAGQAAVGQRINDKAQAEFTNALKAITCLQERGTFSKLKAIIALKIEDKANNRTKYASVIFEWSLEELGTMRDFLKRYRKRKFTCSLLERS